MSPSARGRLRVVVISDSVGDLDSWDAGVALARGWASGSQVAVVPMATGGPALGAALGRLVGGELDDRGDRWLVQAGGTLAVGVQQANAGSWAEGSTSAQLGRWLAECLADVPRPLTRVVVDLTGLTSHDAGAGLLGALGAVSDTELEAGLAGLAGLRRIDLTAVRGTLAGVDLVGVTRPDESASVLLGLQGSIAARGFEARVDPARLLAAEAAAARLASALGGGLGDAPGGGASGGAGLAILGLGGRVVTGADLCAELAHLHATVEAADVLVVGCDSFDVGTRGGPVVARAAAWAEEFQRPCLVFALTCGISRREMRTLGVEAAYDVAAGVGVDPGAALTASATRIATGWLSASGPTPVH